MSQVIVFSHDTLGAFSLLTLQKRLAKATKACKDAARSEGDEDERIDEKKVFKARGALRRLRTVLRCAQLRRAVVTRREQRHYSDHGYLSTRR